MTRGDWLGIVLATALNVWWVSALWRLRQRAKRTRHIVTQTITTITVDKPFGITPDLNTTIKILDQQVELLNHDIESAFKHSEAVRAKFEAMQERIYQAVSDSAEADRLITGSGAKPPIV